LANVVGGEQFGVEPRSKAHRAVSAIDATTMCWRRTSPRHSTDWRDAVRNVVRWQALEHQWLSQARYPTSWGIAPC